MAVYHFLIIIGGSLFAGISSQHVDDPKLQYRFYTFLRGNFTRYVDKHVDPWLIYLAPTGKLFDSTYKERVKVTARKYRGLVKVGVLYVSSQDDVILRKYADIGFTEMDDDWILCLPYGLKKNQSSSFRSVNRAFKRCMKSIPSTVHETSSLVELNDLTFNAIVKFTPARFVLLSLTNKEHDFMKVAAQRYKNYFLFARMDPKLFTNKIASEYSIGLTNNLTGTMILLFMERVPGRGLVKRAITVGALSTIASYPDAIEILFQLNIRFRHRLPGLHAADDVCDPHKYMAGIMAIERKWFPRFVQALNNAIGCGSLIRKKLDSMSVPVAPTRSGNRQRTEL